MCDTFVATPAFTGGNMILGKNSDREPNEAQSLERHKAADHAPGAVLRTTFIEVPQARHTFEVILSRPFHMWGAEMGVNEHNVAIGNEAVFTKVPIAKKNDGLTGMDLIRLALERSESAEKALECITQLLEQYGQDACGGYNDRGFFYHNSFIIADPREAFVLETADRHWAALRVKGFRSISNGLTIESEFDFSSKNLIENAKTMGWIAAGEVFNFRKSYSDKFFTHFSKCHARQAFSMKLGEAKGRALKAGAAMEILRSHNLPDPEFSPSKADMSSLCMHATGLLTPSQTTGSLVAELRADRPSTFWFTGTAAPCISLFKPFFTGGDSLTGSSWLLPGARPDRSLWWEHEKLHRMVLNNYQARTELFRGELKQLQDALLSAEGELVKSNLAPGEREALSRHSLDSGLDAVQKWRQKVMDARLPSRPIAPLYRAYRWKQNRSAGIAV